MAVVDRIMKVDFMGPVALTKAVLPYMVQQRSGHIAVTSSTQGMERNGI
jgi:NADP-dependent 3-hydroxy acid dehydrogenase YdfG